MTEPYDYLAKIIFIGDTDVGKSCLLFRLADKSWYGDVETTIGVEFRAMRTNSKKYAFKLQLWDTSGQEKFRSIIRSYYRQGTGCLLVFDLTKQDSFENLEFWYQDLQKNNSNIHSKCILLVGTKNDLTKERTTDEVHALEFVKKYDLLGYVEVSSKTGTGMDKLLTTLVQSYENLIDSKEIELPNNIIIESFSVEGRSYACCNN